MYVLIVRKKIEKRRKREKKKMISFYGRQIFSIVADKAVTAKVWWTRPLSGAGVSTRLYSDKVVIGEA